MALSVVRALRTHSCHPLEREVSRAGRASPGHREATAPGRRWFSTARPMAPISDTASVVPSRAVLITGRRALGAAPAATGNGPKATLTRYHLAEPALRMARSARSGRQAGPIGARGPGETRSARSRSRAPKRRCPVQRRSGRGCAGCDSRAGACPRAREAAPQTGPTGVRAGMMAGQPRAPVITERRELRDHAGPCLPCLRGVR